MNSAPKELLPGDSVSWSYISKQMEDIAPENWTFGYVQLGDPTSTISGKQVFATFVLKDDEWRYSGECFSKELYAPKVELPMDEIINTLYCVDRHSHKFLDKELEAHVFASLTCMKAYRNFIMSEKFRNE
jgi:hypothetical protein